MDVVRLNQQFFTHQIRTSSIYNDERSDGADSSSISKRLSDLEQQPHSTAMEDNVSGRKKLSFLGGWFLLNLLLTMSNKAVLAKVYVFVFRNVVPHSRVPQASFPWLLTTMHTAITAMGCFALVGLGSLKPSQLTTGNNLIMLAFSVLFTSNIAASNLSLALVSVPLHQVLRSTCPVAAILIYRMLGRIYSTATYLSIIPLILGVGLATLGDYYCTFYGLCLTLLSVVLAAAKTVSTNRIMTGSLDLSALEVLLCMSPLATVQCVVCAFMAGEVRAAHLAYLEGNISGRFGLVLIANGLVAFLLNIVSLQANKMAGALTMTVAGNIKQALTILLGILMFNVKTGPLNAAGIGITVAGAAWYSKVELDTRSARLGSS